MVPSGNDISRTAGQVIGQVPGLMNRKGGLPMIRLIDRIDARMNAAQAHCSGMTMGGVCPIGFMRLRGITAPFTAPVCPGGLQ